MSLHEMAILERLTDTLPCQLKTTWFIYEHVYRYALVLLWLVYTTSICPTLNLQSSVTAHTSPSFNVGIDTCHLLRSFTVFQNFLQPADDSELKHFYFADRSMVVILVSHSAVFGWII